MLEVLERRFLKMKNTMKKLVVSGKVLQVLSVNWQIDEKGEWVWLSAKETIVELNKHWEELTERGELFFFTESGGTINAVME
jgi:hypothetical protein